MFKHILHLLNPGKGGMPGNGCLSPPTKGGNGVCGGKGGVGGSGRHLVYKTNKVIKLH
jgi:hypothetical protein